MVHNIRVVHLLSVSLLLTLFCIDRLTKAWVTLKLQTPQRIIPGWFELEYFGNTSIAFFWQWPLWIVVFIVVLVMLVVVALLVYDYRSRNYWNVCTLSLVLVGAFSNVLDRVQRGFVVDFISVPFWSVFNLADIYIVVGVALYVLRSALDKKRKSSSL